MKERKENKVVTTEKEFPLSYSREKRKNIKAEPIRYVRTSIVHVIKTLDKVEFHEEYNKFLEEMKTIDRIKKLKCGWASSNTYFYEIAKETVFILLNNTNTVMDIILLNI